MDDKGSTLNVDGPSLKLIGKRTFRKFLETIHSSTYPVIFISGSARVGLEYAGVDQISTLALEYAGISTKIAPPF
jgi:hypothetical protein